MQIVINIPDETYEKCKRIGDMNDTLFEAIRKGIVLPKNHGDLIDRDKLNDDYWTSSSEWYNVIEYADVLIPADKDGD